MEVERYQKSHKNQRQAGMSTEQKREGGNSDVGFSSCKRHQVAQPSPFRNEEAEAGEEVTDLRLPGE